MFWIDKNIGKPGRLPPFFGCGSRRVLNQSAALAVFGLAAGLYGIGWGLPSDKRLASLLPAALRNDPGFLQELAESWKDLYAKMEKNNRMPIDSLMETVEVRGGWSFPPTPLLNSYRSYFLRSANADEQKNLTYLAHMRPRELNFEPYGVGYGGAYLYPLGVWYAAATALRAVHITPDIRYYMEDPARISAIFKTGRLFSVVSFIACAVLLSCLRHGPDGTGMGLFAGLFFLSLPASIIVSHYTNLYGWACLWCLVGFRYLFHYLDSGKDGDLLRAGAALGMCCGSSIAFVSILAALPLACLLRIRSGAHAKRQTAALAKAALAAGFTVFITNPYLFLRFRMYHSELAYTYYGFPLSPSLRLTTDFLLKFLTFNMGALASVSIVGTALFLAMRMQAAAQSRLVAWMFLLGYAQLSMRMADPSHGRHFLPYIGLGCLLAAELLSCVARSFGRLPALALAAILLFDSGSTGISYLWNMGLESGGNSARLQAAHWINEHVPEGRSIGLTGRPQPYNTPPFRFDRYTLVLCAPPRSPKKERLPDYIVLNDVERFPDSLMAQYRRIQAFPTPRLLPWVPVPSHPMINLGFEIYKRK